MVEHHTGGFAFHNHTITQWDHTVEEWKEGNGMDDELHQITLSLTIEQYERLRTLSYNTRRSISHLVRDAVDSAYPAREEEDEDEEEELGDRE